MSLSVSTAAFVTAGDYIAGVLDNAVTPRLYSVNSFSGATTTTPPTSATTGVNPEFTGFPTVGTVQLVAAGDGVNDEQLGYVKLTLVPNASDVANASSPMQLVLSPNALVIVASTSTG